MPAPKRPASLIVHYDHKQKTFRLTANGLVALACAVALLTAAALALRIWW